MKTQARDFVALLALRCALMGCLLVCNALEPAEADIRLSTMISDGMVLQRDARVALWGWSDPHERIRIEFQGKTIKIRGDTKGQWSTLLGPFPPGGPYTLVLTGKNSIIVNDILIGDVWLASGQSNMLWPLRGSGGEIDYADQEVAEANFSNIRLFHVSERTSPRPEQQSVANGWHAVTPESVPGFSAVAYLFGRELYQRYGVPIGLIQSTWGGTVAEAWVSDKGLQNFPEFHAPLIALNGVTEQTRIDYDRYVQRVVTWYRDHEQEDRGRINERDVWSDPTYDASAWSTRSIPQEWAECDEDLGGFGGVVWYRRTIHVPTGDIGNPLTLHLGRFVDDDTTYFNGRWVGETQGRGKQRHYRVQKEHVLPGDNVIAIRLRGYHSLSGGCTALLGPAEQMNAEIGHTKISLRGTWSYATGPDLRDFPRADLRIRAANPSPNTPSVLFNGMINPLIPVRIKGVIWYQGESNVYRAWQYRRLFPALIQDWRRHWGYDFPFLFVQLAGFGPNGDEPADYPLAELREAQSMALSLPATGMSTAMDIGDQENMHPSNKQDVARRLAMVAAHVAYGDEVVHSGPTYHSMQIEGGRVRIKLSNLGSGLLVRDPYGYVRGFQVAAADGRFYWARAEQDGNDIVVFSHEVHEPKMVRYAWQNTPDGNIYNREGFPALPFRTDVRRH